MKYLVSISWSVQDTIEVEADSPIEAEKKAYEGGLPDPRVSPPSYVDDSFLVHEVTGFSWLQPKRSTK